MSVAYSELRAPRGQITHFAIEHRPPHRLLLATNSGHAFLFENGASSPSREWSCQGGELRVGWIRDLPAAWTGPGQSPSRIWKLRDAGEDSSAVPLADEVSPTDDGMLVAGVGGHRLMFYQPRADGSWWSEPCEVSSKTSHLPTSLMTTPGGGAACVDASGACDYRLASDGPWRSKMLDAHAIALAGRQLAACVLVDGDAYLRVFDIGDGGVQDAFRCQRRLWQGNAQSVAWSSDDELLLAFARWGEDVRVLRADDLVSLMWTRSALPPRFHPAGGLATVTSERDRVIVQPVERTGAKVWVQTAKTIPPELKVESASELCKGDSVLRVAADARVRPVAIYRIRDGQRRDDVLRRNTGTPAAHAGLVVALPRPSDELLEAEGLVLGRLTHDAGPLDEADHQRTLASLRRLFAQDPGVLEHIDATLGDFAASVGATGPVSVEPAAAKPPFIGRDEWLALITSPAMRAWWTTLSEGLERIARERDGLVVQYRTTGFLTVRFRGVGLSNSVGEPGSAQRRNVLAIGYEQDASTSSDAKARRKLFVPVVSAWIGEQVRLGRGTATKGQDSRYLERRVEGAAALPAAGDIADSVASLLARLDAAELWPDAPDGVPPSEGAAKDADASIGRDLQRAPASVSPTVLTDRQAADMHAAELVGELHRRVAQAVNARPGNQPLKLRAALTEAVRELPARLIDIYSQVEGVSERALRDELVATIQARVTAFIQSSHATYARGANAAIVALLAAQLEGAYVAPIPRSFDLALYDKMKKDLPACAAPVKTQQGDQAPPIEAEPTPSGPLRPAPEAEQRREIAGRSEQPMDFLILTALEEERDAVLRLLPGYQRLDKGRGEPLTYYRCVLDTERTDRARYSIVVTCIGGMGTPKAAVATSNAVARWRPDHVLLIGIAGGVEGEVNLGDVVVASQVVDATVGKTTDGGREVRWEGHHVDASLHDSAVAFPDGWQGVVTAARPETGEPIRRIGVVASGGDIVASADVVASYQGPWPKLIGIEMEGGGTAAALHADVNRPRFLMVRGVSDLANRPSAENAATKARWRVYAADVAACYAIALLQRGPAPALGPAGSGTASTKAQSSSTSNRTGTGEHPASTAPADPPDLRDSLRSPIATERLAAIERVADLLSLQRPIPNAVFETMRAALRERAKPKGERARLVAVLRQAQRFDEETRKAIGAELFLASTDDDLARSFVTAFCDDVRAFDQLCDALDEQGVPRDRKAIDIVGHALGALLAQVRSRPAVLGADRGKRAVYVAQRFKSCEPLRQLIAEIEVAVLGDAAR